MLSLLLKIKENWQLIIVITSLFYGLYESKENSNLQAKIALANSKTETCNYQLLSIKNTVIQQAKESEKLEADLRLKEKDAAARAEMSQKRVNELLKTQFSLDCNKAIKEGIAYLSNQ